MDEYRQIDEELNVQEMEKEMEEDPRYWLFTAVDHLDKANEVLWNKGEHEARPMVLKAYEKAKMALKLLEGDNGTKVS